MAEKIYPAEKPKRRVLLEEKPYPAEKPKRRVLLEEKKNIPEIYRAFIRKKSHFSMPFFSMKEFFSNFFFLNVNLHAFLHILMQ
ncbi:hypothetical protein B9Z55_019387 [Caenorhabditis nigoni]|uniref:Uncharacterized protein n=1 Tax=Caenorhabditis nigoni TaxID=1611254 RepID=A0A2G5TI70_9PELO|nr:hypothetical protein B9Z55_019387 [Caenorhabditis nigoni]